MKKPKPTAIAEGRRRCTVPLREYDLRFQLAQFVLQLGQLAVRVLNDGGDVIERFSVGGDSPEFLGTLLDLELLSDLSPYDLLEFLQLVR